MPRPRQVTDEAILAATRDCVLERGPHVSLDVVAERLGVTPERRYYSGIGGTTPQVLVQETVKLDGEVRKVGAVGLVATDHVVARPDLDIADRDGNVRARFDNAPARRPCGRLARVHREVELARLVHIRRVGSGVDVSQDY